VQDLVKSLCQLHAVLYILNFIALNRTYGGVIAKASNSQDKFPTTRWYLYVLYFVALQNQAQPAKINSQLHAGIYMYCTLLLCKTRPNQPRLLPNYTLVSICTVLCCFAKPGPTSQD